MDFALWARSMNHPAWHGVKANERLSAKGRGARLPTTSVGLSEEQQPDAVPHHVRRDSRLTHRDVLTAVCDAHWTHEGDRHQSAHRCAPHGPRDGHRGAVDGRRGLGVCRVARQRRDAQHADVEEIERCATTEHRRSVASTLAQLRREVRAKPSITRTDEREAGHVRRRRQSTRLDGRDRAEHAKRQAYAGAFGGERRPIGLRLGSRRRRL